MERLELVPWGYDFEAMILFCKKALVHRIIQMRKLLVRVEFLLARTTGNVLFRTLQGLQRVCTQQNWNSYIALQV